MGCEKRLDSTNTSTVLMFKKIFRSSGGHPHDFIGLRKGLSSQKDTSSSGQETETASVTDTHNHENRHFLGKPFIDNSKSDYGEHNTSDTWDPFDSNHVMRKSKSFSFKFLPPVSQATMTKSRSVHFAEDLASYQAEMKRLHEIEVQSRGNEEGSGSEDSSEASSGESQGDVEMDGQTPEGEEAVAVSQSGTECGSNESYQSSKSSSDQYSKRSDKSVANSPDIGDSATPIPSASVRLHEGNDFDNSGANNDENDIGISRVNSSGNVGEDLSGNSSGNNSGNISGDTGSNTNGAYTSENASEVASEQPTSRIDRQTRRSRKAGVMLQSFFPQDKDEVEKVKKEELESVEIQKAAKVAKRKHSGNVTKAEAAKKVELSGRKERKDSGSEGNKRPVDADSKAKSGRKTNVNFSDSTDVELGEDTGIEATSIVYPIYKQVYRMIQLEYKDEAHCSLSQLQRDISEGLMDVDQILDNNKAQALKTRGEMRKLKALLADYEENWSRRQLEKGGDVHQAELKAQINNLQAELSMKGEQLDQQLRAAEGVAQAHEISAQAHEKSILKLGESLAQCEQHKAGLVEQHAKEVESWKRKAEVAAREKEELSRQIRTLYRKAVDVEQFQAAESRVLMETNTRLEAAAKCNEDEKAAILARVVELEAQVANHQAQALEHQARVKEYEHQLEQLQAQRALEKEEEQAFNLELKREFKEMSEARQRLSTQHGELERTLQDEKEKTKVLAQELHTARGLAENLTREGQRLKQEVRDRNMDLTAVRLSNQVAVASLQQIIQLSYKTLAPRFQPESTRPFSQIYLELVKIKLIDDRNKGVVTVLLAFLQTGLADIVRQYEQNEEALGAEMENRRRFQEEVLSTFRSIVKQVVGMNREKRPRSPKKKKAFK